MVRLKIASWEFDFEAVCPTLDHDLEIFQMAFWVMNVIKSIVQVPI